MELVFDIWTIIARELTALSLVDSRTYYSLQLVSNETRYGIISCLPQPQAKKQFVRKITDDGETKKEYWILPNGKRNGTAITTVNNQVAWHSFYLADYCLFETRVDLVKFKKPEEFMRHSYDGRKTVSADYDFLGSGVLVRKTVILGDKWTFYMSNKHGDYFSLYYKLGCKNSHGGGGKKDIIAVTVMETPTPSGYELIIQTDYYKIIFDLTRSSFYSLCNEDFKEQIRESTRKLRKRELVEDFARSLATTYNWKYRSQNTVTYKF